MKRALGVLAVLALLLLIAAHLTALGHDAHWVSPLLLADHVFALIFVLALLAYALALGRKVGRPLLGLTDDPVAEQLAALAFGVALLGTGVLLAGFLRLYYGASFLLAWAALTLWLRAELAATLRQAGATAARWYRAGMPSAPSPGQRAVLLVVLLNLGMAFLRAMDPLDGYLVNWDGLAYHLAAAKIYLQQHSFVPLPDMPLANAPSLEEMLALPGLSTGLDNILGLLNVCFAVLLAVAMFRLAGKHFGAAAAWLAVLLLASTYWLNVILAQALTDFASTFPLLLALSDVMRWSEGPAGEGDNRETRGRLPGRWRRGRWAAALRGPVGGEQSQGSRPLPDLRDRLLIRAGLLAGLGVACKLTAIPAIPTMMLVVGLLALARRGPAWQSRMLAAARACLLIGLAAALVLGPWLLKNAYFFGHPLYPIAIAPTTPASDGFAASTTAGTAWWTHAWWLLSNWAKLLWNYAGASSILLLAVPFLPRRRGIAAALIYFLAGGALWLNFVIFASARYYLVLLVLADILAAAAYLALARRLRPRPLLVETVALLYLLANALFVVGTGVEILAQRQALAATLGTVSRYDYLAPMLRPYQAEDYVNHHTPPGAEIAVVGVTRGFYLDRPYLGEWYGTRLARLEGSAAGRQAELALWCGAGVHYALFGRGDDQYDAADQAHILDAARFQWLRQPGLQPRLLFSAHGVDVLAVRPCEARRT